MVLKWMGKAAMFLLVVLFLTVIFSTISSRIHGGTPQFLGKQLMSVLSGSMEPGIRTGSIIAVEPVMPTQRGSFKPGDVITFKSPTDPGTLITHRIVSVTGSGKNVEYTTRGDNNDGADTVPVPASNVVARYADFTIPYLGYFLAWVRTKMGIAMVMVIPGLVLILSSVFTVFRSVMRTGASQESKASSGESPATNG